MLPEWDGVVAALSEKRHGGMSFNRHETGEVVRNRHCFLAEWNLELTDCVSCELVHGVVVAQVGTADKGRGAVSPDNAIAKTDALITSEPGLILTTTHADCAPVYYFDKSQRTVGLAHAGWRGILAGLPGNVVRAFGGRPEELQIAIGPTICAHHYPVEKDVADAFAERFGEDVLTRKTSQTHLHLASAIRSDLTAAGVPASNIEMPKACTYCEPALSSWRRDRDDVKPMLAFIVLRS